MFKLFKRNKPPTIEELAAQARGLRCEVIETAKKDGTLQGTIDDMLSRIAASREGYG